MRLLVGIFVGGQATRMGGIAKGLLKAPGAASQQTLVERLSTICAEALPDASLVLVGQHPAYAHLGLDQLADVPVGAGPLAGLGALCNAARAANTEQVVTLACDMPYLKAPLLQRLAAHALDAPAVAPRLDNRWQPFCARYRVPSVTPSVSARLHSGKLGLQGLLTEIGARAFPLEPGEEHQLRDWDTPEDI
jgi:molybdenum cofactor guanylyltransferase